MYKSKQDAKDFSSWLTYTENLVNNQIINFLHYSDKEPMRTIVNTTTLINYQKEVEDLRSISGVQCEKCKTAQYMISQRM